MAYEEEWETTSGLPLEGLTATITKMEFILAHEIAPNVVAAKMTVMSDDGIDAEQLYSVGTNHKPNRDGSLLEGDAKFSDRSNFGMLLTSAREIVENIGDELGSPRVAANWVGTKWTFKKIEVESGRPGEDAKQKRTRFVFGEYHGRNGDAPAEPAKTGRVSASKSTTKASSQSTPAPTSPSDIAPELWDSLVELANEHETHSDFANVALDLKEVEGNKAAQKAIAGQGKGSVWAARG